jgi:hypothetical protein
MMDRVFAHSIVGAAWSGRRVDHGSLSTALKVAGIPLSRFQYLKKEARRIEKRFRIGTVLTATGGKRPRARTR